MNEAVRNERTTVRGRSPHLMVGESYRDAVDRLAGQLRAAEMDRDAARAELDLLKGAKS